MPAQHHTLLVKVKIEIRQESEDSYVATCPQLGCIFVHEETEEGAYRHAREAIDEYILTSLKHDDPIPDSVVVSHEVTDEATEITPKAPVVPFPRACALDLTSTYDVAVRA